MGKLVADIIVETLQNAGVMQVEPAIGMALHSARATLRGRGGMSGKERRRISSRCSVVFNGECAMRRCGTPYRFAARHECGHASLPWADRNCSTRGSYRLCP
jgi:hypothetical protein